MQQFGVSAVLILLLGTFLSSEGLKSFDWREVLKTINGAFQKMNKYYTFYKYFRYTLDVLLGPDGLCPFKCPDVGENPFPRPGHKPSSNGCGSRVIGFSFNTRIPVITDCCDRHDRCYDTCGQKKRDCDVQFQSCLNNICRNPGNVVGQSVQVCEIAVSLTFDAVMILGCDSYLTSQRAACVCRYQEKTENPRFEL